MRKKTLLFLASLLAVAQGAWADGIKYLEREWVDGALVTTEKTVTDYSPFTPNSFYYDADIYWLRGGYFVANTDCTISRDIMVANDVHIILMDGKCQENESQRISFTGHCRYHRTFSRRNQQTLINDTNETYYIRGNRRQCEARLKNSKRIANI